MLAGPAEERKITGAGKFTIGAVYSIFNFLLTPGHENSFLLNSYFFHHSNIYIVSCRPFGVSQSAITWAYKAVITWKMIKCFKTNNLNQQERKWSCKSERQKTKEWRGVSEWKYILPMYVCIGGKKKCCVCLWGKEMETWRRRKVRSSFHRDPSTSVWLFFLFSQANSQSQRRVCMLRDSLRALFAPFPPKMIGKKYWWPGMKC